MLLTTLLEFLICGFHCCCSLSYFIFDSLLAWIIFPRFLFLFAKTLFDFALVDSNMFEFLHYYSCALCKMATFHATRCSDLTIMVDESRTTAIFEHCLCPMFVFQLGFLHISKDVSYDFNNFVSSFLYQILMISL